MDGKAILALPMEKNDADAQTIRGYLQALLRELWNEGEGFSGKRPFGNSGWESDLYKALVAGEAVPGKLDDDGWVEHIDKTKANKAIFSAIGAL